MGWLRGVSTASASGCAHCTVYTTYAPKQDNRYNNIHSYIISVKSSPVNLFVQFCGSVLWGEGGDAITRRMGVEMPIVWSVCKCSFP